MLWDNDTPLLDRPRAYPPDADPADYDRLIACGYADGFTLGEAYAQVPDTAPWRQRLTRLASPSTMRLEWHIIGYALTHSAYTGELQWRRLDKGSPWPDPTLATTSRLNVRWWLPCRGAIQTPDLELANSLGGRLDFMALSVLDGDLAAAERLQAALAHAHVSGDRAVFHLSDDELGWWCLHALDTVGYARDPRGGLKYVASGGLTTASWQVQLHSVSFSDAALRWTLAVERAKARQEGDTPRASTDPALLALPMGPNARERRGGHPDHGLTANSPTDEGEQASLF